MVRHRVWCLVFVLLAPTAVLAAGNAAPGEEADAHGGGGADIFAGDWGTVILTVAVFTLLAAILGKWAWKPILTSLQKREEHIRRSIDDAAEAQSRAEETLRQYQEQLAQAQAQAAAIIDQGRTDADALAHELMKKAKEEGRSLRTQAEQDIGRARDQALEQIYQQAGEFAAEMARKIIKKDLNHEDHRALLTESLSKLQTMASEG